MIEAQDGAEAVELGRQHRADVAVLDLNMPRLDGVEAALRLRALHRSPRIALQSSDPELLRQRASGLGLPLFDKADPERLLEWVARQAKEADGAGTDGDGHIAPMAPKVDLSCSRCGYGIVCRTPPERCPMCSGNASWIEPRGRPSRHALLHERLPG